MCKENQICWHSKTGRVEPCMKSRQSLTVLALLVLRKAVHRSWDVFLGSVQAPPFLTYSLSTRWLSKPTSSINTSDLFSIYFLFVKFHIYL